MLKEKKKRTYKHYSSIRNLLGEEQHILLKTIDVMMVFIFTMIVMVIHILKHSQQKNILRK